MKKNLTISLNLKEDEEIRKFIKEMIVSQVRAISRELIANEIRKHMEKVIEEVEILPDDEKLSNIERTGKDCKEIDWEQRRFELFKVVLSSYCSKPELIKWGTKQIARYVINTVDELIKELKLR